MYYYLWSYLLFSPSVENDILPEDVGEHSLIWLSRHIKFSRRILCSLETHRSWPTQTGLGLALLQQEDPRALVYWNIVEAWRYSNPRSLLSDSESLFVTWNYWFRWRLKPLRTFCSIFPHLLWRPSVLSSSQDVVTQGKGSDNSCPCHQNLSAYTACTFAFSFEGHPVCPVSHGVLFPSSTAKVRSNHDKKSSWSFALSHWLQSASWSISLLTRVAAVFAVIGFLAM